MIEDVRTRLAGARVALGMAAAAAVVAAGVSFAPAASAGAADAPIPPSPPSGAAPAACQVALWDLSNYNNSGTGVCMNLVDYNYWNNTFYNGTPLNDRAGSVWNYSSDPVRFCAHADHRAPCTLVQPRSGLPFVADGVPGGLSSHIDIYL